MQTETTETPTGRYSITEEQTWAKYRFDVEAEYLLPNGNYTDVKVAGPFASRRAAQNWIKTQK